MPFIGDGHRTKKSLALSRVLKNTAFASNLTLSNLDTWRGGIQLEQLALSAGLTKMHLRD